MKFFARALLSGVFAAAALGCARGQACRQVTVEPDVEIGVESAVETEPGSLTLADLLAPGSCAQVRAAAARVQLGSVPRAGSVRVLDGGEVRRMLVKLEGELERELEGGIEDDGASPGKIGSAIIPARVVVRRKGETKSCAEIARFVARAAATGDMPNLDSRWREDLDCAGARGIPEKAVLEVAKSGWNAARARWEFALRCARPGDCIPFMVWVAAAKSASAMASLSEARRRASASGKFSPGLEDGTNDNQGLVKAGQTATLTWDERGIRVVLPVTCLDAGGLGQFVRVRLKNAARILRAEVVGQGTLRAIL
jgi:hypothetical protein